ncbi:helix-turn-helix transcriptional regulator [Vibrio splendidus]
MSVSTLLSTSDITKQLGLSRATIYRWMDSGDFPLSIQLPGRRVAWFEHEIQEWLDARPRTESINRPFQTELNEVFK